MDIIDGDDVAANVFIWQLWVINDEADIINGDDVAVNVSIFMIKLFGSFAVNEKGELTISGDSQSYHGEWKVRNILVLV